MPTDRAALARAAYAAYETGDRAAMEALAADGSRFRNTEVLTFAGDRLTTVEVYFGWNL